MNNRSGRVICMFYTLCLVLSVTACGSKMSSTPVTITQSSSPPVATKQDSSSLLLESYRQAHEKRDLDALAKLYCDDGVPRVVRTVRLLEEGNYLAMPIVKMSLNSVPRPPVDIVRAHGVTTRPNLAQVAELEVQLKTMQGQIVTRNYPIGLKNGSYLIINRVTVN